MNSFIVFPAAEGRSEKLRLAAGTSVESIDEIDLRRMFNKDQGDGCANADFLFSTCRDILRGGNILLVIDDEAMDFEEFKLKAPACIRSFILAARLFSGSDIRARETFLLCSDSAPVCAGVASLAPKCGAAGILALSNNCLLKFQRFTEEFNIKSCSRKLHETIRLFEYSFSAPGTGISISLLLTALEMLFGFAAGEDLRDRVASNAAAFISGTDEEFRDNYNTIKSFYRRRPKHAHSGRAKDADPKNAALLQHLVSRVLQKYIEAEKTSEITEDTLAEAGFGSAG